MKRSEVLNRLKFRVPECKKKRVIISSDVKNEADDQFAIMHHLLTPSEDVRGIIAAHYESNIIMKMAGIACQGKTMEYSYEEGQKVLELAEIEDVPMLKGSRYELSNLETIPESEGAEFIIQEALREDERPLYVAVLGAITDVAIAYLKNPEIADRLTVIWIGGAPHPKGGEEFNLSQDRLAANVVFESSLPVWQVPYNAYRQVEVSLAELSEQIMDCGEIGNYLCEQMFAFNEKVAELLPEISFPHGEIWCLGDNPTVSVLFQGEGKNQWREVPAPHVNADFSYKYIEEARKIRVYDYIDSRLTLSDFFAKMHQCYRNEK